MNAKERSDAYRFHFRILRPPEQVVRYLEIPPCPKHPRDRDKQTSQSRILAFRVKNAARRPFLKVPRSSSRSLSRRGFHATVPTMVIFKLALVLSNLGIEFIDEDVDGGIHVIVHGIGE